MRCVDKAALLAVPKPIEAIPIPELGDDSVLYLRVMSGWERSEIEKRFSVEGTALSDPGMFRGAVLVRSITDEAGVRMFGDDDIQSLMDLPAGIVERLFEKACSINGFTQSDVEELEKN